MKLTFIFSILTLFVLVSSCRTDRSVEVISQSAFQEEKLDLSMLNPEIKYIAIDDSVPIRQIFDIKGIGESLVISTSDGLQLYSGDGSFIMKIGDIGNGPEEYPLVSDFCVDKNFMHIYLLARSKILVYDIEGNFLKSFKTYNSGIYEKIRCYNGNIYLFDSFSFGDLDNNWVVLDTNGGLISTRKNYIPEFESSISHKVNLAFENNGNLFYWNPLNDTIFEISKDGIKSGFIFAAEPARINQSDLMNEGSFFGMDKWLLTSVLGYKNYLILGYEYIKEQKKISVWYNILTNKGTIVNILDSKSRSTGIDNNWDSNIRFSPKSKILLNGNEYLVSWEDAYGFREKILDSDFKSSIVAREEKKNELFEFATSLSESSNPVITLVRIE